MRAPQLRRRAAQELLVDLGQFARDDDRPRPQHLLDIGQRLEQPVRSFVEDQSRGFVLQPLKRLAALHRAGR